MDTDKARLSVRDAILAGVGIAMVVIFALVGVGTMFEEVMRHTFGG